MKSPRRSPNRGYRSSSMSALLKNSRGLDTIRHSERALCGGWGLIEPIFSIFIIDTVRGATLVTVGISAAIYWVLRSVIQLPLASFLDKYDGEKDDFYALILGIMIAGGSAVLFAFVREPWPLYLAPALHGIGFAFYFVSCPAIFSRHLDKNKFSFEWALDNTAVSVGAGLSAFFGGVISSKFGFPIVFISAGVLSAFAALMLMIVPELLFPKPTTPDGVKSKMSEL